jgi:cell division protease FtsH
MFMLVIAFGQIDSDEKVGSGKATPYSEMLAQIKSGNIKEDTIEGRKITAVTNSGTVLRSTTTELDRGLIGDLMNNDVKFDVKNPEPPSSSSEASGG